MLGWFALRPDTSIEDAEWLLARAAGFDAGFALATSLASSAQLAADANSAEAAKRFGATVAILDAVKQWETARTARAFPPEVKAALRDNAREFHLEPVSEGHWNLFAAYTERFTHDAARREATQYAFQNPHAAQPLQWVVRCEGKQPVTGVTIEINGKPLTFALWPLEDLAQVTVQAGPLRNGNGAVLPADDVDVRVARPVREIVDAKVRTWRWRPFLLERRFEFPVPAGTADPNNTPPARNPSALWSSPTHTPDRPHLGLNY
jgi:hypothetical protein